MNIISHQMIFELNSELKEHGFSLKLADACGNQTVKIIPIATDSAPETPQEVLDIINKYLRLKFMKANYDLFNTSFSIQQ